MRVGCTKRNNGTSLRMSTKIIENTWIPLPDGRKLAARIWLPETGPSPAILEYLPYRKRGGVQYGFDDGVIGETLMLDYEQPIAKQ